MRCAKESLNFIFLSPAKGPSELMRTIEPRYLVHVKNAIGIQQQTDNLLIGHNERPHPYPGYHQPDEKWSVGGGQ